jgi:cell division protein FtsN
MINKFSGATKKKRHTSARKSGSITKYIPKVPNLGAIVLGVVGGIGLTSFVFYMFSTSSITLQIPVPTSTPAELTVASNATEVKANAKHSDTNTAVASTKHEPRFDFYTELTKSSHDTNQEKPAKLATLDLKSATKPINAYLVQAGVFSKRSEADALKAKLTLNGLEAKIEISKQEGGSFLHRVILGPFKTEASANEHKQILKSFEVDEVLVLKNTDY